MRAINPSTGRRVAAGSAVLLALLIPASALAASTAWTRQFGTTAEDVAGGIAADSEGITVVGTTGGELKGDRGRGPGLGGPRVQPAGGEPPSGCAGNRA